MPFKYCVFEASKVVSTKTLLLKHCCRRQGFGSVLGSVSGPFRGVGWGRGGVGERGFCKGKEYH